ncbi:hypothetical protein [Amycolatopsis pittospori]|uniref:hypothetical protein n=1 Tax=Amycolatopsis pittospori TaxID=2749434 RepID=UPI0015F0FC2E|nr:hypothetical protein [Amycolatopsis pittospori]
MSGPFDPLGSSGSGYEVYPEALRRATEDVFHAAGRLRDFANVDIEGLRLGVHDVGMLGEQAGIVEAFNGMIANLQEKSTRGFERLISLGDAMDKAADYYDAQDEEYYKRLRDLEKDGG